MKIFWSPALFLALFLSLPVAYSNSSQGPEDQDTSGDDEESSGSGLAEHDTWNTDAPVMSTGQTTRTPSTSATASLQNPEDKSSVLNEGFTPNVLEDYTKKTNVIEYNTPTVSIRSTVSKVIDENTSVPLMETMPGQITRKADVINPEAVTQSTTVLMTTGDRIITSSVYEDTVISDDRDKVGNSEMDSDFHFDHEIKPRREDPVNNPGVAQGASAGNLLERQEVLAGVIAGGVVGLMLAVMLVTLMIYRMKKKDEGSYALDEHRHPNGGYQKPQKQVEFLA